MTFFEEYKAGKAKLSDINLHINAWHEADTSLFPYLPSYLGLTEQEYANFVENPKNLELILNRKLENWT